VSEIDRAFERTREGETEAFTSWVRFCEVPLRKNLRSFARVVDVEAVMQECLLRMWRLAPTLELSGEDASLRYALTMSRNLALSEARRLSRVTPAELAELERLPGTAIDPDPPSDPGLRRAIRECFEQLAKRSREALLARARGVRDLHSAASLETNEATFRKIVSRARQLLRLCLESRGVRVEEYLR
jgi:DNA-directed RNA polymerase specialized sigma24 family protein